MSMPGPLEIGLIFLVALIFFGPKRLPEMGRSIGKAIQEFKKSMMGGSSDDSEANSSKDKLDSPSSNSSDDVSE